MRALLGFVALAAVACAALPNASAPWASITFTTVLASLLVATLSALYRRGKARAFSAGFVVVGSCYLTLSFGPWFTEHVQQLLVTTTLLDHILPKIQKTVPSGSVNIPIGTLIGRDMVDIPGGRSVDLSGRHKQ